MDQRNNDRDVVPVEARPVEVSADKRSFPPIVAKTVNICVGCVQGAGRAVREPMRRRYHRHYHPRHRFGRHHLAADLVFVGAIAILLGVNVWLLLGKPPIFPSRVRLSWEAPATLRVGDAATFSLHFTYNGDTPLDRSTIALQFPAAFRVHRVEPGAYDAATRTLTLPGVLAPGASGTVTVGGVITEAVAGGALDLRATFYGSGESRAERTSARAAVPISGAAFTFNLDAPKVARLGETVAVRVSYGAVAGASPTSNAEAFRVAIAGPLVRTTHVAAPGAAPRSGEVRWPFRAVRPDDAAQESFTLALPTSVDAGSFQAGMRVRYVLTPEIVLASDADGTPIARIVGPSREIAVAGELSLATSGRYFTPEGDQLGRGPLPPRVGQTTKYWVTWDLRASIENAERIVVRAALPPGVEWVGRAVVTVGDTPTFDAASRTVAWRAGALERAVGGQIPAASASFEVALIPTPEQVGTYAPLLGETTVDAVDVLGVVLAASAPTVTTELPFDQLIRGKGRVVAQ